MIDAIGWILTLCAELALTRGIQREHPLIHQSDADWYWLCNYGGQWMVQYGWVDQ